MFHFKSLSSGVGPSSDAAEGGRTGLGEDSRHRAPQPLGRAGQGGHARGRAFAEL